MKRSFRLAAAFAALLAVSACTNSGMDASGLQPLRAEQAASANPPPPPGIGLDEPRAATPTAPAGAAAEAGTIREPAAAPTPASATPPAPTPTPAQVTAPTPAQAAPQIAPQAAPQLAAAGPAAIHFAPVVGASAQSLAPMTARLAARAGQRGLGIAAGDASATHVLKGYFSAFTENRETTVIYVWDVLDPAGNRVHRIQGQQKVPGAQGEGWSSVTAQAMEGIADRTIDDLATWLASRSG